MGVQHIANVPRPGNCATRVRFPILPPRQVGRAVRHWTANPATRVQIPDLSPKRLSTNRISLQPSKLSDVGSSPTGRSNAWVAKLEKHRSCKPAIVSSTLTLGPMEGTAKWLATGFEPLGDQMHSGWAFDSSTFLHFASVAPTVERLAEAQGVRGSNPFTSTILREAL